MSAVTDQRGRAPWLLRVGAATDTGRVRDHNEDSAMAEGGLFVVADGMGGHAAGEVASGIAIETMRELVPGDDLTTDDITRQLALTTERIRESVTARPERRGMGTTVSGLVLVTADAADHWAVFNVGDSRVYRYGDGMLTQITVDHSEVQELVAAGTITADEARVHPARHVLTRALGADAAPRSDIWVLPASAGERFVLCSDGLTNEITDAHLRDLLAAHSNPQVAAEELVRAAVEAGGRDNVTVVVVNVARDVDDEPSVTSPGTEANAAPRAPQDEKE